MTHNEYCKKVNSFNWYDSRVGNILYGETGYYRLFSKSISWTADNARKLEQYYTKALIIIDEILEGLPNEMEYTRDHWEETKQWYEKVPMKHIIE